MNNVIKSLLFSFLIAATVSVKSGQIKPPTMPETITVGTTELKVHYNEEGKYYYVVNKGQIIKVILSNRPGCLSPVFFAR